MYNPRIEIIATNHENCHFLENNVLTAIAKLGINAQVNCITDAEEANRRRLGYTPALVINGRVVGQGKTISSRQIQLFLLEAGGVIKNDRANRSGLRN
jgi:Thioredoxin domain